MASSYSDEFRAQVVTEWMAGASLNQLAAVYKVPKATVQGWVKGRERAVVPKSGRPKNSLEGYDLEAAAVELIDGSVRAFTSILRAAEDPTWIKRHNPSEAAILAGVIADKLYRLLGAIQKQESDTAQLPG